MSSTEDRELQEALSLLAQEDLATAGDIDFETLIAFRRGRLEADETARVQRALVADPELARAALDLGDPADLPDLADLEAAAPAEPERRHAAWQRFEAALGPTDAGAPRPDSVAGSPSPPSSYAGASTGRTLAFRAFIARHPLSSVAATFILASGLTFMAESRRDAATGRILYESLEAPDQASPKRGGTSGGVPILEVTEATEHLVLFLIPPFSLSLAAELPAEAEFSIWREEKQLGAGITVLQKEGHYAVMVDAQRAKGGSIRITLRDPALGTHLGDYPFIISRRPEGP